MERSTVTTVVITCVVILICCICLVILVSAGIISGAKYLESVGVEYYQVENPPGPTPVVIRPDAVLSSVSEDTYQILGTTNIPINDMFDLAYRLEGKTNIPHTIEPPQSPLQVGTQESFWVTDTDIDESFEIDATLQYATDHAYFWIENGVRFDENDLRKLAETFEEKIYPTTRKFFGSEWTPGVDGDPHLYIIYADDLGYNLAGYFSAVDEYPPDIHEYSNAHETFVLNADNLDFGEEFAYGVVAHEFQHMIHWYQDRNESSWLNEGFAELAAFLNGYNVGGSDYLYINNPDLQLNDWPNDPSKTSPHYGASFLFLTYFLDRLGETATQTLFMHPSNGMTSIDEVLSDLEPFDPLTSRQIQADDIFLDWILASFIKDEKVADGRYTYHNYPEAPRADETETIRSCPSGENTRNVHQFGVDYIRINCRGDFNLHFEGSVQVGVLPTDSYSGEYAFWSNKGDESDMTLTRSFDFRDQSGPLTFTYWTWFDIEKDYDYIYVEISKDGGDTWQILTTPSGTLNDPTGNSYGWAYNGFSGIDRTWIQEKVDLSVYAGDQIQIRFEYVTDAAVNGEGFLIDDIAIPEMNYFENFEVGSGGWDAAGFVRIKNILPQTFRLALITLGNEAKVTYLSLNSNNSIDIPLSIGSDVDEVVLVVTGTTRFTRQEAAYRFEITP